MDAKGLFGQVLAHATAVIDKIEPEDYNHDVVDSESTVRDLIERMLKDLTLLPDILDGKTAEELSDKYQGNLLDDEDLQATWHTIADAAIHAVTAADLDTDVHLISGKTRTEEYLHRTAADLQANLMTLTGRRAP